MRRQGGGRVANVVGNDGVKFASWEIVPAICCAEELIFTATLAEQYGAEGTYVNAVNPGPAWPRARGVRSQATRP
jgi:3-oxoacyl-[acyl-carrier protein] reductase